MLPSHADPMNPESDKVMITILKIVSKEVADKLEMTQKKLDQDVMCSLLSTKIYLIS
jgi:hypothetical protein